jgi:hypothetical protein
MPFNYEIQAAATAGDASAEVITACLQDRYEVALEEHRFAEHPETYFDPNTDWPDLCAAREWWPNSVPQHMSWAASMFAALHGYAPPDPSLAEQTLMTALGRLAQRVQDHITTNGGDPAHPNESRADRARRLNRERVAAHRERQRATAPDATDTPRHVGTWARVQELRRGKREAKAHHDEEVRLAHEAMMVEVKRREDVMAFWDKQIAEAEEAHRKAKGAPDLMQAQNASPAK